MKNLRLKISTLKLFAISAIIMFAMLPYGLTAQINLKKLKDKVSGDKNNSQNNSQNSNQNQNNSQGNVSTGNSGAENFSELASFYKIKIEQLKRSPLVHYNFGQLDWDETSVKNIEEFNMPGTLSKMEQDKQKYPKLFMIYPKTLPASGMNAMTKSTIPSIAVKAGENEDFPYKDDDAKKVNQFYLDYMYWKTVSLSKQRDVSQLVNKTISNAESALKAEKLEKSAFALRAVSALKSIQPENPMLGDLEKRALQVQDKCFDDVKDILTGELHKTAFKKLVGFTSKPAIGKEDKSTITNEIVPGKPFFLVGYFANKIKELDLKGYINGIPTSKTPLIEWSQVGTDNNNALMQLYWNENMMQTIKEQSYFVLELFPDINTVNYKSHLEYIPIMNFVKWLTYQMPGKIDLNMNFSNGQSSLFFAANVFTINLTSESIAQLKVYYDKLAEKKLKAVTINDVSGCTDQKAKIGRKEEMKKYGEAIKITVAQFGQVMKPWPNDNQVEYYTGDGYGVFKRTDGKFEIINLNFTRHPSTTEWDFSGASGMNHYELKGSTPIKAETLNLGYEITKEGIEKCSKW